MFHVANACSLPDAKSALLRGGTRMFGCFPLASLRYDDVPAMARTANFQYGNFATLHCAREPEPDSHNGESIWATGDNSRHTGIAMYWSRACICQRRCTGPLTDVTSWRRREHTVPAASGQKKLQFGGKLENPTNSNRHHSAKSETAALAHHSPDTARIFCSDLPAAALT